MLLFEFDALVHNPSHVNLTETLLRTLGLGLRFRRTVRSPTARGFDCQVQDFCRSVRLQYKYANKPDDSDFNPKLYVKSGWNPPWKDCNLESSLYNILQDLLENFNKNKSRWRNNLSSEEQSRVREIKEDPTVRVPSSLQNG